MPKVVFGVAKELQELRDNQKRCADQVATPRPPLKTDDNVRMQTGHREWKPAKVVEMTESPRSVIVETPEGRKYRRNSKYLHTTKANIPSENSPTLECESNNAHVPVSNEYQEIAPSEQLKIDAGDDVLKKHFSVGSERTKYTSNIEICGSVVREKLVTRIKSAFAYSILADESCDLSGKEQLAVGIRFSDEDAIVHEEFLGFTELEAMDAKTIANAIYTFVKHQGLNPMNCVSEGYEGRSTMPGKDAGVQKLLRQKYPKALYFHCASHRLNLVVNDLSNVSVIRNTVATIKYIIVFFANLPHAEDMLQMFPYFVKRGGHKKIWWIY
ncbi:52 kDa repressor of the inhibitor of the protein kinase-like [Rhagoletis pomonella]|uniref:52 kDa repressor of the inhibitor of the protein kinase-like n=1 Tax=Rhagoletis pomonella TaxID=28610 RepID=UPI00177D48DF|nr:52 kDa repressor of the inhibitor of the protein kinase-like [Rhagoletis pomonella]